MSYCNGCVYAGLTSQECYSCSCGSNYRSNELEQLKKENAELKKETKRLSAVDETNELLLKHQNSLKKEVHDLRKENEELKEQMGRAGYRIAELKMQIEKMKNCQNCKHDRCRICISEIRCENLKQWELTE